MNGIIRNYQLCCFSVDGATGNVLLKVLVVDADFIQIKGMGTVTLGKCLHVSYTPIQGFLSHEKPLTYTFTSLNNFSSMTFQKFQFRLRFVAFALIRIKL